MPSKQTLSFNARLILFRTRQENEKEDERSTAGKVAAGLGAAAALGGFYAYGRSRPAAIKRRADLRQAQYVAGLTHQAAPTHVPKYHDGGFDYGVKPSPAPQFVKQSVGAKAKPVAQTQSLLRPGEKGPLSSWQAERRNKIASAAKKTATVKVGQGLSANVPLTQFQYRNTDGTMNVSTNPLTAYRKASRVVPWVRRSAEAAGDIGDIASGKEVKDPFYKKPWFKRAALTAAVAAPIVAANFAHVGESKQAHGIAPRTGKGIADKIDRATHAAANAKKKIQTETGFSQGLFGEGVGPTIIMLSAEEKPPSPAVKRPNKLLSAIAAHKNMVAMARTRDFAYADALEKGWDVRDARGRSARVYAPGSKKRERREKTWDEKVDNLRLIRNAAVAGAVVGGVSTGILAHKLNKANAALKPKVVAPAAPSNIVKFPGRKVMASAKVSPVWFAKKEEDGTLEKIIDSASEKIELPEPKAPEGIEAGLKDRRHPLLRAAMAASLIGGGVVIGSALHKAHKGRKETD